MNTVFEVCIFLLMVGVPLQLFYWYVVRAALLVKIRFDLERLLQKLQTVETNRDGQAAVVVLVKKCQHALRGMDEFDIVLALFAKVPKEVKLQLERDAEIVGNAPMEIREFNKEVERLAVMAAVFNSPGFVVMCLMLTPILMLVALICLAIGKLKNIMTEFDRRLWGNAYEPKPC